MKKLVRNSLNVDDEREACNDNRVHPLLRRGEYENITGIAKWGGL
jgi:hypothetical protein